MRAAAPWCESTGRAAAGESMAIALDTLVYARKLREVGFSVEQAEGQAVALAAAMSDSLLTKQDLSKFELRLEPRFSRIDIRFEQIEADLRHLREHLDTRFAELERRLELRLDLHLAEQDARIEARFADLDRRLTIRLGTMMIATAGAVSALARLL